MNYHIICLQTHATQQLADAIYKKLNTPEYSELMNSVILTNKVCVTLPRFTRMVLRWTKMH